MHSGLTAWVCCLGTSERVFPYKFSSDLHTYMTQPHTINKEINLIFLKKKEDSENKNSFSKMKDNADKDTWEIHNRCYIDEACHQRSSENTAAEGFLSNFFLIRLLVI